MDASTFYQQVLTNPKSQHLAFLRTADDGIPPWLHNAFLVAPLYIAAISLVTVLGQAAYALFSRKSPEASSKTTANSSSRFSKHIANLGGPGIFVFHVIRLLASLALVGLTVPTSILFRKNAERSWRSKDLDALHDGLSAIFIYASVLALVTVVGSAKRSRVSATHAALVLLAPWVLYAYRDLWPLCTFTVVPADAAEGAMMWARVALLTVAAVVVPLFGPRQFTPIDPEDVPEKIPLSDTASYFALAYHSYNDPVVLKANQVEHLKMEELPPLSDRNWTRHLVKRSYNYLDPLLNKSKWHLALRLVLGVFPWEHAEMALMLILRVVLSFVGPIGINRLLNYIETGGEGAIVRPWVWVTWLLLGPAVNSVAFDWFTYRATHVNTKSQAILTQLIFDHALRMRVKSDAPKVAAAPTAPTTPDNASVAESSGAAAEASEGADNGDSASVATSATKVQPPKGKADTKDDGKKSTSSNLVGKLNNLVTQDLATIQGGQSFMMLLFYVPPQIIMSMLILQSMLGWSVWPGLAAMALMIPVPGYVAKLLRGAQVEKMTKSDSRVQSVTETMNVIRMIKLFGWESKMNDQLSEKRDDELKSIRKLRLLSLLSDVANNLIPLSTIVITYGTYTMIMKQDLTASKVFASMAIFEIVQEHFAGTFYIIPPIIKAKVAFDRIQDFLDNTELLDEFTSKDEPASSSAIIDAPEVEEGAIGIRAASFTWAADSEGTATPGRRNFTLRIEDEVFFKRGTVNLVIGQTGSGKTSLLMALLGEMHYTPTGLNSIISLPRKGGVAYHAQESWVLNETIKENILFGSPYDEERYNAVLDQCGLKPDLALWSAGDQTEVGEKGLTLSGGQKARVTLARAVYSPAEILLLDDVLAALDVHTAKWIVEKCFKGELLRGRTVILVTHNIALTAPVADFVVSLGTDGRIASQGDLSTALAKDKKLQALVNTERQAMERDDQAAAVEHPKPVDETTDKKPSGQLIVEEEVALGHLSWSSFKVYLAAMRGSEPPLLFWSLFLLVIILSKVTSQLDIWVLGVWAGEYETHDPSTVPVSYYLGLYVGIVCVSFMAYAASNAMWVVATVRASRRLHQLLIESVLGTTLRWLDRTPISRVITRCTQDIASIDGSFCNATYYVFDVALQISFKFGAVIIISPIFLIPGVIVIAVGALFGHVYMRAQLPVKRESSNMKAPVLAHFGSAIAGLVSIRAYGAQAAFRKESYVRLDRLNRAQITYWDLNRWIGVRSSTLAGMFASGLAAYLIYGPSKISSSATGFSLTMAVGFSSMILWAVRLFNMAEIEGNSMERVEQYLRIEQEPQPSKAGKPPAYWPASGDLTVEGLSARYSPDGPKVLHDLTFQIKSGERIGIVGRTGSGKSSLTLALLRCILTEGKVYYDGIPTDSLNLDALRSNITIIPQVPELLSGTLRQNLDPFSQHDDAELNDALRSAGLFSLQGEDDENRITLDTAIAGGGGNLSVGQRQILALARAIVRRSKLLILDEATSAIDYATDNIIQTSLREKLDKDVTLLTVAHRLQTIIDSDRILVLDAGRIAEFDKPIELLKNEKGFLRRLVDESGDKEKLIAMASGADRSSSA